MLCYFVMNYDVGFPEGEMERPENLHIGASVIPKIGAEIMIRSRI